MNERIRELQSKSYLMCKQIVDDDGHVVVTPDKWFDVFAELLVKECVSIVSKRKNQAIDDGCNIDEAMSMAEMDIEEHFGVEE